MNQKSIGFVFAAVLLCAAGAGGQAASSGMAGTYANVEAGALKKRPQDAWARSIAFKDQIVAGEAGKTQRLDRRTYVPLELKSAGTAWIREDLYAPFAALPPFTTSVPSPVTTSEEVEGTLMAAPAPVVPLALPPFTVSVMLDGM